MLMNPATFGLVRRVYLAADFSREGRRDPLIAFTYLIALSN